MQGTAAASGVLATLASLFKLSKREEIAQHAPSVLQGLKACNTLTSDNTLLRKLSIKLSQVSNNDYLYMCHVTPALQRLGAVFLPAQVASWRYQRGLRSLTDTLSSSTTQQTRGLQSPTDRPLTTSVEEEASQLLVM